MKTLDTSGWKTKEEIEQHIRDIAMQLEDEEANEVHAIREWEQMDMWEELR